jgi:hypothetical protein
MVESNHDEERMARVEHMIENLQRQTAALKVVTSKLVVAVAVLTPSSRRRPHHRKR